MMVTIKIGKQKKIKLSRQEALILLWHLEGIANTYDVMAGHLTTDGDAIYKEDIRRRGIFNMVANAIDEELWGEEKLWGRGED